MEKIIIGKKRIKGTSITMQKVENNGETDFEVYDGEELIASDMDLNTSYKEALKASGLLENIDL